MIKKFETFFSLVCCIILIELFFEILTSISFKFLSKREDLSYVASGFTTHLGTSLSQHPQINVVPETTANFIDKNELTNTELKSKYSIIRLFCPPMLSS